MGLCIGLLGGGGVEVGAGSPPTIGSASSPMFLFVPLLSAVGFLSSLPTVGLDSSFPTVGAVLLSATVGFVSSSPTVGGGKAGGADGRKLYESMFGTPRRCWGA